MFGQPKTQLIQFLKSKVAAPTFWVCSALTSAYAEAKPAMSGSWSVNSVMPSRTRGAVSLAALMTLPTSRLPCPTKVGTWSTIGRHLDLHLGRGHANPIRHLGPHPRHRPHPG